MRCPCHHRKKIEQFAMQKDEVTVEVARAQALNERANQAKETADELVHEILRGLT